MKLKEFRSVQKLSFRTEGLARAWNVGNQGCFPRLNNFCLPKYETERKVGRVNSSTEDAHYVQPQALLVWGAESGQLSCNSLPQTHKSPIESRKQRVSAGFQTSLTELHIAEQWVK